MKLPELFSYIDTYDPKPAYAQVGVNGEWEAAAVIDFDEPSVPTIFNDGVDASIAGEVFYTLNDGRTIFIGFRYAEDLAIGSPVRFLEAFVGSLATMQDVSPSKAFEQLGQSLNNDPNTYLNSEAAYAELGVVDYWKSFGSLILRKRGDPDTSPEGLEALVSTNVGLISNDKNYIAMEFAYPNPVEHWVAVQVSELKDGQHCTNLDELHKLVNVV